MSYLRSKPINKIITKWTSNSFTNYPLHQCYYIINRYINSNVLFNELNESFNKLKQKQNQNQSKEHKSQSISKSKYKSKHIDNNKSKSNKITKLLTTSSTNTTNTTNKQLITKQTDSAYLDIIQSKSTKQLISTKSIFDKYEMIASEMNKQQNEYNNELIIASKNKKKKENIDIYIRKEIESKSKQKNNDLLLKELDYYDMEIKDLISHTNITKDKQITCINQNNEINDDIINKQLTLKNDDNEDDYNENDMNQNQNQNPYDTEIFGDLIEFKDNNKIISNMSNNELIKSIDWTKLENYIELNGWNNFASFLNQETNENENEIIKSAIPGFLNQIPKKRLTLDRPKAIILQNEENAFKIYKINQEVNVEPIKYLRNGNISLLINNKHYGFIKKSNLVIDLLIGSFYTGYVYDINYYGKIEIVLEKPMFWSRITECQRRIIDILKYCNNEIEISDKCSASVIKDVFQMSKSNFKKALGILYKNRIIEIFNKKDQPQKIILNRNRYDLSKYDVGKETETRMWKSKPIWEYGIDTPPYNDILPNEIKERQIKQIDKHEQKFTLRKSKK